MKHLLLFLFLTLPTVASAQFSLSQITGNWRGDGVYADATVNARLRCQLQIAGTDAGVAVGGRCASSLGGGPVAMVLRREADGTIVVQDGQGGPREARTVTRVAGRPDQAQVVLRGASDTEAVIIHFGLNGDGTLLFATEQSFPDGRVQTSVVLSRR